MLFTGAEIFPTNVTGFPLLPDTVSSTCQELFYAVTYSVIVTVTMFVSLSSLLTMWQFQNMLGDSGGVPVPVFMRKKFLWTCVWFWVVTVIELFESANTEALWMIIKKEKLLT